MSKKTVFITQAIFCVVIVCGTTGCQHLQLADNPMPVVSDDTQTDTPTNQTNKLKDKPKHLNKYLNKQTLIYLLEDWF